MNGEIDWPESGPPRSRRFGDVYFSAEDGLAETRHVFLAGCGLPEAWRDRRTFRVAELGFGTGLNVAALLDLWSRAGPVNGHLSVFSVEAHPIGASDAARAFAAWPELSPVSSLLVARWPGRARGFHRVEFPEFRASLDLAVMEAGDALSAWSGPADAWFLDGFSPALNPEMWREEVLRLVGQRSAPAARLGTYTVAGDVRRGLTAAGFEVERAPGFGTKRQRLEGRMAGRTSTEPPLPRVAIIGAGIAGVSLARAFAAAGAAARVFDSGSPMASAGPAALVAPRLDAGLAAPAALFAQAFARARTLYSACKCAVIARGALQLVVGPKDHRRFRAIAGSDLFEPGEMRLIEADESSQRLGEAAPAALALETALVVDPAALLQARFEKAAVARLQRDGGVWRLMDTSGRELAEAEIVCIAAGMGAMRLLPGLPLRPVRGQASVATGVAPAETVLFGGYVAPTPGGVIFGATHDRDDESLEARAEDHVRNLAAVAQSLPEFARRLGSATLEARVGVRATTSDYLPLAGAAGEPGLFVLSGLGSRGFTLAPLLAEHVVALALGLPSPLPEPLSALVEPARFAARARRRQ